MKWQGVRAYLLLVFLPINARKPMLAASSRLACVLLKTISDSIARGDWGRNIWPELQTRLKRQRLSDADGLINPGTVRVRDVSKFLAGLICAG